MRKTISLFLCLVLTLSLVGFELHHHDICCDSSKTTGQTIDNHYSDGDSAPEKCYYCVLHSNHHLAQFFLNYNQYQKQEIFEYISAEISYYSITPETKSSRAPPFNS